MKRRICLLGMAILLLLPFGCALGAQEETTAPPPDTTTTQTTQDTTPPEPAPAAPAASWEEIPFDFAITDVIYGDWEYYRKEKGGQQTFYAGTRRDFLALFEGNYERRGPEGFAAIYLEDSEVYMLAEELFTDRFFEKYDVIVYFFQHESEHYTGDIDRIVQRDGETTVHVRKYLAVGGVEYHYFRGAIAIIAKGLYQGTPLRSTYQVYDDPSIIQYFPLNRTGHWPPINDGGLVDYMIQQTHEKSLAVLEKYRQ